MLTTSELSGKVGPSVSKSFFVFKPNPFAKIRLFCFHFGGGSAQIYKSFAQGLDQSVEIVGVQLPGRAERIGEAPIADMNILIQQLVSELNKTRLLDKPFALFGHCSGAVMAFEFARALRQQGVSPLALVVSSSAAPQIQRSARPVNSLDDDELMSEMLRQFGEAPNMALLQHPKFRPLFFKYLRADFKLLETYQHQHEAPLNIPVFAMGAESDCQVKKEDLLAWKNQTSSTFEHQEFSGDHYYWMHEPKALLARLNQIFSQFQPHAGFEVEAVAAAAAA